MGHPPSRRVPLTIAAAALLALLTSSCGQGAPTDSYELSGRVSVFNESGEDGGPVARARVTFSSDTLIVTETRTDDSGRYRIRVLTDHPFGQVRAEAEGFRPGEASVYFDSPQRRVDLELRRLPAGP